MRNVLKGCRLFFCFIFLSQLAACSNIKILEETISLSKVAGNDVVLVGTIELIPKLAKNEQEISTKGVVDLYGYFEKNRNSAIIMLNNKADSESSISLIHPKLGKTFFFTVPKNMKYMVDGYVAVDLYAGGIDSKVVLPVGFKIDIKPGDKAVYIGKLIYKRDDFNSVTSVKLVDDYTQALKQFKKKFGSKVKLRKSLLKKI